MPATDRHWACRNKPAHGLAPKRHLPPTPIRQALLVLLQAAPLLLSHVFLAIFRIAFLVE